jgi:hypothetical protein
MKPETQSSIDRFTLPGQGQSNIEFGVNLQKMPEVPLNSSLEKNENKTNFSPSYSDVVLTTAIPQPVINDNSAVQITSSNDDTPAVAADDDLIEKEWVDKAKKIVSETKDNPRKREEDVSKLQIDYLAKRYGRKIGAAGK